VIDDSGQTYATASNAGTPARGLLGDVMVNPDGSTVAAGGVVEATLKPGTSHIYAKRVFYIDEDSWAILATDKYDGRGELWRYSEQHNENWYNVPMFFGTIEVHNDLQSGRYIAMGLRNEAVGWQRDAAQGYGRVVTAALGGWGIFGVELFVKGDRVWFSEVSPRPHDTGMVTMITQAQSEFELHARAILGLPVSTALRQPGASAVIYGGVDGENVAYRGLDQALMVQGTAVRLFGKPASHVRRRMGVALAVGEDIGTACERAREAASRVHACFREDA